MNLVQFTQFLAAVCTAPYGLGTEPQKHPLVTAVDGDVPIVLSAPHGGTERVPDVPVRRNRDAFRFTTGRDVGTDVLVDALAEELAQRFGKPPFLVRARFHRRYVDANRRPEDAYETPAAKPIYDAYHHALANACTTVRTRWGRGLLLDIHGQVSRTDTVIRGTNDGKTVSLLRQRFGERAHFGPESLIGRLEQQGLKVYPTKPDEKEIPNYRGGYIVQTYGSHDRFAMDAIQLEFGSDYRRNQSVKETARQVAVGVEKFARQYLPINERPGKSLSAHRAIHAP